MSEALVADATVSNEAIATNARRLLFAGFFAILTAGVGPDAVPGPEDAPPARTDVFGRPGSAE